MSTRDVDFWRKKHLSIAEAIDAWRIIPRAVVAVYGYGLYKVIEWYMNLEPYFPEEFLPLLEQAKDPEMIAALGSLMVQEPTTQHSFLVSTVVGVGAAVFGLYTNSSKKWNGFTHWHSNTQRVVVNPEVETEEEEIVIPKPPISKPTVKKTPVKK